MTVGTRESLALWLMCIKFGTLFQAGEELSCPESSSFFSLGGTTVVGEHNISGLTGIMVVNEGGVPVTLVGTNIGTLG